MEKHCFTLAILKHLIDIIYNENALTIELVSIEMLILYLIEITCACASTPDRVLHRPN